MKWCAGCLLTLDPSSFHRHAGRPDGLASRCRACKHASYVANAPRERARRRARYPVTGDRERAQARQWQDANRERMRELCRLWRRANPEAFKAGKASWALRNPGNAAARQMARHAAKKSRTPPWLDSQQWERIRLFYALAAFLTATTGVLHHVDHIVPLQGARVSGLHVPWNLQAIPAVDNIQKGNRQTDELASVGD